MGVLPFENPHEVNINRIVKEQDIPVGKPSTKSRSGPGWKSFILFLTYRAPHSAISA